MKKDAHYEYKLAIKDAAATFTDDLLEYYLKKT